MKNFKFKNKEIEFSKESGSVLSQSRSSKTHVSSSGGSRFNNPKIYSRTETDHDFWIKNQDGIETAIKLKDREIQIRPDQHITIVSAKVVGKNESCKCLLINHTACSTTIINSGRQIVDLLNLMRITGKSILIAALLVITLAALGFSDVVFQGAGWAFLIYRAMAKSMAKNKLGKDIDQHMLSLADDLMPHKA